ncbi:MAG: NADH-quinone oxidoreductase subunit J [Acidimicrobiia bacterium]|nr:NADH-quinone oxidoreductase subunit J [Acidimicrobiia bacterium]
MSAPAGQAVPLLLGLAIGPTIAAVVIGIVMVVAGIRLVTTDNVVHAAISLMGVLAGVAATFMLLGAEFLGWTQVLVYIGAIVVLFLFGVMLTRARLGEADLDAPVAQRWAAAGTAVLVFGLLTTVFVKVFGSAEITVVTGQAPREPGALTSPTTAADLAHDLFRDWVLPFEAVSLVLLAALIGAIVLARRDDREHTRPRVARPEIEVIDEEIGRGGET